MKAAERETVSVRRLVIGVPVDLPDGLRDDVPDVHKGRGAPMHSCR